MASNLQQEILRRSAAEIAANIVDAIKNKPIKRRTKNKGQFSSVVNASGALAGSVKWVVDDKGFRIYAYDYIDYLIYGRPSTSGGGDGSLLQKVTEWIPFKIPGANPFAVTSNIHRYGTSIWQEHKGKDSGLLSNAINQSVISKIRAELASAFVKDVMSEVSYELRKMVA